MEKHTAYFNLLEQLRDPACPVCVLVSRAVQGLLERYLEESVVHEDTWDNLKAAGGWCARHAKRLEGQGDGLAVSLFYGHLLEQAASDFGRGKAPAPPPRGFAAEPGWLAGLISGPQRPPCPGCAMEADVERTQSRLLGLGLDEAELWAALEAHPGLCLEHVATVAGQAGAKEDAFTRQQAAKLKVLAAELELFVRRSEHGAKEAMGAEADAWRRALRRYYGLRFS